MNVERIFLVGPRCSGKTTVGRLLAGRLGWEFADIDDLVEAMASRSIADIINEDGEANFRDLEEAALEQLHVRPKQVVATGGGVVLRPGNRRLLKTAGFVVWLTAPAPTLFDRMMLDPMTPARRPNLTSAGGFAEVEELLRLREPHYRNVAQITVDTAALSPTSVVSAILAACGKF